MPLDIFNSPTARRNVDAFATAQPGWGPGLDPSFFDNFGEAFLTNNRVARDIRIGTAATQHVQDWIDQFEKVAGYAPPNPEFQPDPMIGEMSSKALYYEKLQKSWETERRNHPELALPPPPTAEQAHQAAIEAERQRLSDEARRSLAPQGLLERAGGVVGGMASVAVDPINLASMTVGVPPAAGILRTALAAGLIGGASQLAISAASFGVNREINPDYGAGDVATEAALAGAGGAVLGAGVKGLALLWGRALRGRTAPGQREPVAPVEPVAAPSGQPAAEAAPAAPEPVQQVFPRTVMDAGNVVEREAAVTTSNPYRGGGLDGEMAHARNSAEAEAAVIEGRSPVIPEDTFSAGTWRPGKVFASDGKEVGVKYEVVEADSLVASQRPDLSANPDYPAALQPRDRSRAASAEQINEIAAKLNPERLGPSADAATGAPIVGPDNLVESGNGRWLALKTAYARGGAPAYRDFLRRQGFETDGLREPVLVARRVTPLSESERIAFTDAANRVTTLRMSAPEQALADARLIDAGVLDKLDATAGLAGAENRPFVKGLLAKLPQAERGGLIDRHGILSAEGIRRVEAAMLARAYGDPALLSRILESPESGIKALGGALTDSAGPWAAMRDAVSRGTVPAGMNITDDLLAAMRLVQNARDTRTPLSRLVDQAEMFDAPSPATRALLSLMYRDEALTRAASRASVARGLTAYAEEAMKNTTEARLFGEPLSSGEVLTTALAKAGREDLGVAAVEATTPAKARVLSTDPTVDDAVLHRLEQILAANEEPAAALARSLGITFPVRQATAEEAVAAFEGLSTQMQDVAYANLQTGEILIGKDFAARTAAQQRVHLAHEAGHLVFPKVTGAFPADKAARATIQQELAAASQRLNPSAWAKARSDPALRKYLLQPTELLAEGHALYLTNRAAAETVMPNASEMIAARLRETPAAGKPSGGDIMIADPEGTLAADGSPKMVSVKSLVDQADAEIKAANEIEACATPAMAAE